MLIAFIIDDDIDDQEIFSLVINQISSKVECVFANDGMFALEKLKNGSDFTPSLIFIDMNMPRMNGMQCLAELRKINRLQNIPIYMYSTHVDKALVEQCKKYGATGFIQKYIDLNDLKTDLEKIISYLNTSH